MKWENLYDESTRIICSWMRLLREEDAQNDVPGERDLSRGIRPGRLRERLEEERKVRERYDYLEAYRKLKRKVRKRYLWRVAMVACTVVCFLVAGVILFAPEKRRSLPPVALQKSLPVKPGEKKAVLILDGGMKIFLGKNAEQLNEKDGTVIAVDSTGVVYARDTSSLKDTVIYNTLSVPRGGEYFIVLADGTQVWMNADSRLRYPVRFRESRREVELTGEAYFDVTTDRDRPFVVKTDLGNVRVYGTEFNVKCYSSDREVVATLVEGSVAFINDATGETRLSPSQQLVYKGGESKVRVEKVKVQNYVSWRKKILSFENESLEEIMKVLSRWYNVNVVFEDVQLRGLLFTGNLDKYSSIEKFIRLFEAGADVKFEITGDTVRIKRK